MRLGRKLLASTPSVPALSDRPGRTGGEDRTSRHADERRRSDRSHPAASPHPADRVRLPPSHAARRDGLALGLSRGRPEPAAATLGGRADASRDRRTRKPTAPADLWARLDLAAIGRPRVSALVSARACEGRWWRRREASPAPLMTFLRDFNRLRSRKAVGLWSCRAASTTPDRAQRRDRPL